MSGTAYFQKPNAFRAGLANWRTTAGSVGMAVMAVGLFLTDLGKVDSILDIVGIIRVHGDAITAAITSVALLFTKDAATGSQP